jgi:hypothetical protein
VAKVYNLPPCIREANFTFTKTFIGMNIPLILLILCSRNDSYMGNSRWRLETSINLALQNAKDANFLDKLEVVVSDWGSEIPLSNVLNLVSEAKGRVKFIHVPPNIAKVEQKDSKFLEVIAMNAAARRASGEYIGRIDNDTVVGAVFFRKFEQLEKNNPTDELDLADSFIFVERKSVPYRISRISLPLSLTSVFIKFFRGFFNVESAKDWGREFWWSPVGIIMFHRDIWKQTQTALFVSTTAKLREKKTFKKFIQKLVIKKSLMAFILRINPVALHKLVLG